MEIPSLVRSRLGDEDIETAVSLGDEDVVCFTPSRALLYRGEGLLSDEGVEVFSHDVETLDVSEGRRKTKFTLEYVDGTDSFTVPGKRSEAVLERLVDGVLTTAGVIEPEESIDGVFRFSELTLVVTDARLVKHVGTPVWDDDFEEYPFGEVTGLSFEEGSVATQVVLAVGGRPERIKAPNDQAPMVRETLQEALFAYHDVDSLAALNDAVGEEDAESRSQERAGDDIGLSEGISPLVGEDEGDEDGGADGSTGEAGTAGDGRSPAGGTGAGSRPSGETRSGGGSEAEPPGETTASPRGESRARGVDSARSTSGADASGGGGETERAPAGTGTNGGAGEPVDAEEFEALKEQVNRLTRAVKRQNEILESYQGTVDRQRETIEEQNETVRQLIEELRQGR